MKKTVVGTIERYSLIEKGDCITVALSGGADSVALLNVLFELKDEYSFTLKAAHLNHLIRGEEAFRDENFVRKECERLGVELDLRRIDIPKIARERSQSLELAARNERYAFLDAVSEGGKVATAHNADDNLETVIFNLSRGSGIGGLCGIPIIRDKYIRPLLFCSRARIEDYCRQNKLSFVTDSTNLSDEYTRNKIRHNIVPVLRQLNPSVEQTVLRSGMVLREDLSFLESEAESYLKANLSPDNKLDLKDFSSLDRAISKRVIKKFVEDLKPNLSLERVHIEAILGIALSGGETCLPDNCRLASFKHKLFFKEAAPKKSYNIKLSPICEDFFENTKKINNLLLNSLLDCDKIVGKYEVRTKLPGDSIKLVRRGNTKTLNKLFNENAVPVEERASLPVICDEKGVIWVYGIGGSQRCAVTGKTTRMLKIECEEENNG